MPFTVKANGSVCVIVTSPSLSQPNIQNSFLPVILDGSVDKSSLTLRISNLVPFADTSKLSFKSKTVRTTRLCVPAEVPPSTCNSGANVVICGV